MRPTIRQFRETKGGGTLLDVETASGRAVVEFDADGTVKSGKLAMPDSDHSPRGLGDTIANMTKAVGVKPCGGCEKRRQWLNNVWPYHSEPEPQYVFREDALRRWLDALPTEPNWTADNHKPDVALITPVGGPLDFRHVFALCERWMARQDFAGRVQWLVVDDGDTPVECTMGQQHIRRERQGGDPKHTITVNILEALPHVRADRVLFIEADDFYGTGYVSRMVGLLDDHILAGEGWHRVVHVGARKWLRHESQDWHAVLAQTGLRSSHLNLLENAIRQDMHSPWIDLRFWKGWFLDRHIFDTAEELEPFWCGMKGLVTWDHPAHRKHNPAASYKDDDANYSMLRRYAGRMADLYIDVWGQQ